MGGFSAVNPQYSGFSNPDEADQDDLQRQIAKVMSPQSAQSLVPPPPNSPPASDTGQSHAKNRKPELSAATGAAKNKRASDASGNRYPAGETRREQCTTTCLDYHQLWRTPSCDPRPQRKAGWFPSVLPIGITSEFRSTGNSTGQCRAAASWSCAINAAGMGNGSYNVQPVRPAQSTVSPVQPIRQGVQPIIPPGQPQPAQPQPYRPGVPLGDPASTAYAGLRRRAWTCAICGANVSGSY